ncbi:diadenylate cyclase CdaA [Phosphitispora fastidiosa]|uniref:diadenylate cyclase CdaA n=1 Tax=Phosphitispora fastidiosa TaxID=2837202 RepID=UPI001E5C4174|nr:diadenylate cyclase CdaA [Phosphitispora fastidiosa]MBU7006882.1 diadenylate cyclase [Phosphitispora fastidiosa]
MLFQLPAVNLINIFDMLVVAALIYKLFQWIKGTRAVQLLKGIVVLLIATTISDWLGLYTINWILNNIRTMVVVAIPVVFQPELRRALERIGRGKFFARPFTFLEEEDTDRVINEIIRAVVTMSKNKTGALIVLERETGINDYIETGVSLDSVISGEFMINIFIPNSPLHDGAVIIRGDRVAAAGCFLPLTENPNLGKELGTRHRAAIGITEISDAVAIVVSEETGTISLAREGRITRNYDEKTLREVLVGMLIQKTNNYTPFWYRRS